ncbi:hypothetical protein A7982_13972 [Minicystis rosea]|nr:hypothetical protein A7982_13972 [Minicystis rosea]
MLLSCGHWACDFHGEQYVGEWRDQTRVRPQPRTLPGIEQHIAQRAYEIATPRCLQCNGQLTLVDIDTVYGRLVD